MKKEKIFKMSETQSLPINLEFGGGVELLFENNKMLKINLPPAQNNSSNNWTLKELILWMRENILNERPELFMQGGTIRPGILVLVNDIDWELLGEANYVMKPNDTIMFISTLHGG